MLSIEARAAAIYWKLWEDMPIRFARRNPQRLRRDARWRPGRPDPWLLFGPRASLLTGKPFRATTPGNALLNWLYAIAETEMTLALLAVGLDAGVAMFHVDMDRRASLALDGIEAVRPHVDRWLINYIGNTVFANRDFTELPDGEVRLTHPLNSHLAHTAALWRQVSEPVASWLKQSFSLVSGMRAYAPPWPNGDPAKPVLSRAPRSPVPPVAPLPAFVSSPLGSRGNSTSARTPLRAPSGARSAQQSNTSPGSLLRSGLRDDPVPRMCRECGRALPAGRRAFCGRDCATCYHRTPKVSREDHP
jgi:hypothetical protein